MATQDMTISSITWDDVANTATFTLTAPPPVGAIPAGVDPSNWYPSRGLSVTFSAPIRRAVESAPTAIGVRVENGEPVYYKWTWNGSTWVNPIKVNHLGEPV